MRPISDSLYDLLVSQGIAQERTAIRQAQGIDAGERMHSAAHPAIGRRPGGQTGPMGISGKGRGTVKAPPSFQEVGEIVSQEPSSAERGPVLFLVASNKCLNVASPSRMPRAATFRHLVLIQGGKR